jgi:flavin reductase (DIM6/NTAB) family NADH-FMN oxidoreductase RutF
MQCQPWRNYDGGDHTLFLGEVMEFDYRDGDALGYHSSQFKSIVDVRLGIEDLI